MDMKENSERKKRKLSKVSTFHYIRLFYRSVLFIVTLVMYVLARFKGIAIDLKDGWHELILVVIWAVLMLDMLMRFFPSSLESPGCQKQYSRNYHPTGRTDVELHDNNAVVIVSYVWIILNALIGGLHMIGLLDDGIMLLICLAYSVCDMICILFFCPFQTWFLKNRCCSSCRIYNWDYAMMFTPLFFVPGVYTWSLLAVSVALLVRWEVAVWRYPERFSENTNQYLSCSSCTEKLCTHKKQLQTFRRSLIEYAEQRKKRILEKQD